MRFQVGDPVISTAGVAKGAEGVVIKVFTIDLGEWAQVQFETRPSRTMKNTANLIHADFAMDKGL